MIITRVSPLTGKTNSMDLDVTQAQLDEMSAPPKERRYVQDIFPSLTADEREFIMTGYTSEDWQKLFGDDET